MKKSLHLIIFLISLTVFSACQKADGITERYARFLTPSEKYVAHRASAAPEIDGVLKENEWENAPWTNLFTDISGEGFPTPRFETRAKMLWDNDYLYVGAKMEEPDVWAYVTKRDEIIYFDNDFEIFLDPDNDGKNYFEMEFNALANVFDLLIEHPYRAFHNCFVTYSWDSPGVKVATHIDGTLNDNSDRDRGWTIEVAIPRKIINEASQNILKAGSVLTVGFSRVEWQTDKLADGNYSVKTAENGR